MTNKNYENLYKASKEILDNILHWQKTGEVTNAKESKRLCTNLKKAIERIDKDKK